MKKVNYLVIILILVGILTACSTSLTDSTDIESNPLLEDLEYFCSNLEKRHKNLYANISKEEFEIEKQKIAEKTADMSYSDFYYALKSLLSKVGDAHTNIAFTDSQYKYLNALGFAIHKFGDDWHLMMLEEENDQYLGWKLLAINNMEINHIFNLARGIISYDNEVWATRSFSNTVNFREALEYLGVIEKGEPILLEIEDDKGNKEVLEIKSMNEEEINKAKIMSLQPRNMPKTVANGIYSAMALRDDCYYIQYNSCQEAPDLPMKEFVSIVKDEINKGDYKSIIIDLRYNSGGNSRIFEPMISELGKLKKNNNFDVYTIIGENTFSSAIINAIQIKEKLNSKLVGSPTGGSVNHYGEIRTFNLKNTPIAVWYSTKYFELVKGYGIDSLYPDIYVEKSFENYIKGVDSEIDIILETIGK